MRKVFPYWPAWFFGPGGASAVFEGPLEVPEGWHDDPNKVGVRGAKTEIPGYEEAVAAAEAAAEPLKFEQPVAPLGAEGSEDEDGDEGDADSVDDSDDDDSDEAVGYKLPPINKITKPEIIEQLTARKVTFNKSWNEQRLYDLLKDSLDSQAE